MTLLLASLTSLFCRGCLRAGGENSVPAAVADVADTVDVAGVAAAQPTSRFDFSGFCIRLGNDRLGFFTLLFEPLVVCLSYRHVVSRLFVLAKCIIYAQS